MARDQDSNDFADVEDLDDDGDEGDEADISDADGGGEEIEMVTVVEGKTKMKSGDGERGAYLNVPENEATVEDD